MQWTYSRVSKPLLFIYLFIYLIFLYTWIATDIFLTSGGFMLRTLVMRPCMMRKCGLLTLSCTDRKKSCTRLFCTVLPLIMYLFRPPITTCNVTLLQCVTSVCVCVCVTCVCVCVCYLCVCVPSHHHTFLPLHQNKNNNLKSLPTLYIITITTN